MANLTNDVATQLAKDYQPYLLFDPQENMFPAVAEEWLDHQATGPWDQANTHERGTAVLLVEQSATSFSAADVLAGSDAPAGARLQLSAAPPNGIGQGFAFNSATQDLFLDCAGWNDTPGEVSPGDPTFASGSLDYLLPLFSDLANGMNSNIPSDTPHDPPNPPPKFDIPRSKLPTVYAEIEWAGRYPRVDLARVAATGGNRDFAAPIGGDGPVTTLDSYIVINYYLFYPVMEPSPVATPEPGASRFREGQWEAISIFLKEEPLVETQDVDGRPDFEFLAPVGHRFPDQKFVVYSRGYSLGDDSNNPLDAQVRPWIDPQQRPEMSVHKVSSHPIAYVAAGTHKNFFDVAATVTKGQTAPDPSLAASGGTLLNAAGVLAGVCTIPKDFLTTLLCWLAAGILFTIGAILTGLSVVLEPNPPVTESPQSSQPGTDVARDGGPVAVPMGAGAPPSPSGLPPSSIVPTTLRIINRFGFGPTPPVNTYPPTPGDVELPFWWHFPGRWGVRVMNRASGQWDSGTRRTDAFERSRGYWNAYQLMAFLSDAARAQDGIAA